MSFGRALAFVLRWEGGTVDHPDDPGGRTAFGVTQRTYDAWRRKSSLPRADVFGITKEERDAIYEQEYWKASGANALSWPLALVHFDTAVNMGVSKAMSMLAESDANIDTYVWLREQRYREIVAQNPKRERFLKGWLNRVASLAAEIEKERIG